MRSIETAVQCFDENIKLFGDANTQPEKYNTFNGLASLAEGIAELQTQIRQLREEVQQLKSMH